LFVAGGAENFIVFGNKTLGPDGCFAQRTAKTAVVPLFAFVFHFFHTCFEYIATSIASCRKGLVVAVGAKYLLVFGAEGFIDQGNLAHAAEEAVLVPVLVFVGQIFGVDPDGLSALIACVCKDTLVALDAVRVFLTEDVPLTGQGTPALVAAELVCGCATHASHSRAANTIMRR
jgi:hypothetical protein